MKINIIEPNKAFPNGYLEINDARIIWKNFTGRGDRFNREGDRNFHLVIPTQEDCDLLLSDKNQFGDSWNVKIKPARDEDEGDFMRLPVKIKFTEYGPNVYLKTGENMVRLNEDTIGCLDNIEIDSVDLDIRPFDWEVNGRQGRTAYLQSIHVTQRIDRFAARYQNFNE